MFRFFSMKLLKLSSNCLHKLWHLYLRSFQIHHLQTSFRACNTHRDLSFMKLKKYIKKRYLYINWVCIFTHMLFTFFVQISKLYQLLIFLRQTTKNKLKLHRMKKKLCVKKIVTCEWAFKKKMNPDYLIFILFWFDSLMKCRLPSYNSFTYDLEILKAQTYIA